MFYCLVFKGAASHQVPKPGSLGCPGSLAVTSVSGLLWLIWPGTCPLPQLSTRLPLSVLEPRPVREEDLPGARTTCLPSRLHKQLLSALLAGTCKRALKLRKLELVINRICPIRFLYCVSVADIGDGEFDLSKNFEIFLVKDHLLKYHVFLDGGRELSVLFINLETSVLSGFSYGE